MPELTYLLIRIAAHIEINGPIPMGVSFIYSICIFVFVRHTHTKTHTNTHIRTYIIIIYRIMRRSMRAVPECTQIMSGGAKKAAPRANRSSWQAGTAWQVTWPFRRGGCPSPSCPFHPLFFSLLAAGCTKLPGLDRVRDLRSRPAIYNIICC